MPKTRAVKHAEAVERADARANRTSAQQLELILNRPGNSRREFTKLTKDLPKIHDEAIVEVTS